MSELDGKGDVFDVNGISRRAAAMDVAGSLFKVLGGVVFGLTLLAAFVVLAGTESGPMRVPFLVPGLGWGIGLFLAGMLLSALSDLIQVGLRTAQNTEGLRRPVGEPPDSPTDEQN
jgi:hypothetical protein